MKTKREQTYDRDAAFVDTTRSGGDGETARDRHEDGQGFTTTPAGFRETRNGEIAQQRTSEPTHTHTHKRASIRGHVAPNREGSQ